MEALILFSLAIFSGLYVWFVGMILAGTAGREARPVFLPPNQNTMFLQVEKMQVLITDSSPLTIVKSVSGHPPGYRS